MQVKTHVPILYLQKVSFLRRTYILIFIFIKSSFIIIINRRSRAQEFSSSSFSPSLLLQLESEAHFFSIYEYYHSWLEILISVSVSKNFRHLSLFRHLYSNKFSFIKDNITYILNITFFLLTFQAFRWASHQYQCNKNIEM